MRCSEPWLTWASATRQLLALAAARTGQAAARPNGRGGWSGGIPPPRSPPGVRGSIRATLLKTGRWLQAEHPGAGDPAAWTQQTCAAWIAAVDRMSIGDYAQRTAALGDRIGKPLQASAKAAQLSAVRTFFRDCQEWEWLPRRFDPQRALGTPRSVAALLGPNPRVIAD